MGSPKNVTGKDYYEHAWSQWDDMKSFGPGSRHVRRLIFKMLRGIQFSSYLDAGCGAGTLLWDIHKRYPSVDISGVEYADSGVEIAKQKNPNAKVYQLDLEKDALPETFDLVTCVDVLEHILDDISAIRNLRKMTAKYLLVVVPTGPLFEQERINVGHVHGYSRQEVNHKLEDVGFTLLRRMAWGFPFYNLYRRLVMNLPVESLSGKFDLKKRLISLLTYWLLFFNLPFWGDRYFVLCEVKPAA
jgi:trans-aconitate methyltransferase